MAIKTRERSPQDITVRNARAALKRQVDLKLRLLELEQSTRHITRFLHRRLKALEASDDKTRQRVCKLEKGLR